MSVSDVSVMCTSSRALVARDGCAAGSCLAGWCGMCSLGGVWCVGCRGYRVVLKIISFMSLDRLCLERWFTTFGNILSYFHAPAQLLSV